MNSAAGKAGLVAGWTAVRWLRLCGCSEETLSEGEGDVNPHQLRIDVSTPDSGPGPPQRARVSRPDRCHSRAAGDSRVPPGAGSCCYLQPPGAVGRPASHGAAPTDFVPAPARPGVLRGAEPRASRSVLGSRQAGPGGLEPSLHLPQPAGGTGTQAQVGLKASCPKACGTGAVGAERAEPKGDALG